MEVHSQPLAHRARPLSFSEFQGQAHLTSQSLLDFAKNPRGVILWGPPGSGKTSLARLLAGKIESEIHTFNPVLDSRTELKKLIEKSIDIKNTWHKRAVLFIDEIHRFNRPAQDALLPHVEAGDFVLMGATTENPAACIERALRSRVQICQLTKLSAEDILAILLRADQKFDLSTPEEVCKLIAEHSDGDARYALNLLEKAEGRNTAQIRDQLFSGNRDYDRDKDRHYDVISAFIKSLRGSDPDAALLWLAIMLDGGEDPLFIARRLIIFASEDVGNADPMALTVATSARAAVEQIGMPEARIILAQATTYLASAHKSNAAYRGIDEALEHVRSRSTLAVPSHLKNHKARAKKYRYPHDYPGHFVRQDYAPEPLPRFYRPSENGIEQKIKCRLEKLWPERQ